MKKIGRDDGLILLVIIATLVYGVLNFFAPTQFTQNAFAAEPQFSIVPDDPGDLMGGEQLRWMKESGRVHACFELCRQGLKDLCPPEILFLINDSVDPKLFSNQGNGKGPCAN
jgi:hypothetical protein